jgi:hypothetical protein
MSEVLSYSILELLINGDHAIVFAAAALLTRTQE